MVGFWKRMTTLENARAEQLEIRIMRFPTSSVYRRVQVAPNTCVEVDPSWFRYDPYNPDRPPLISVSIGSNSCANSLTCRHFLAYGKIRVGDSGDGHICFSGMKARWTDIKGWGWICGRCYDDESREFEIIE